MKAIDANPMKGSGSAGATMMLDGSKPCWAATRCSRSRAGCVGIVYKGEDPKINAWSRSRPFPRAGVRGRHAREVKERFFREAQSAGRLNHPNIVAIYDAGEEQDPATSPWEA